MSELISVIVPVYNIHDFLDYCVKSIRQQTYQNLEIILVDDGSTDGSGELCEQLAAQDSRIQVIHQQNQGAAAARNSGLDRAKGDYISIIDGDDYIWPEMYQTMLEKLKETKAQFACCPYAPVDTQEIPEKDKRMTGDLPVSVLTKREIYKHLYDFHTMWVIQPNKLYSKSMFEEYRFPHGHFYEDEYAAHRLLKEVESAVYIDVPFYRYYTRLGSATKRGITSRQLFLLDALLDRIAYFREEKEVELLPVAEEHFFGAYRSVAVGMQDRTKEARKRLREIRKQYRVLLKNPAVTKDISSKMMIKRHLYLMMPRIMEVLIQIKNR